MPSPRFHKLGIVLHVAILLLQGESPLMSIISLCMFHVPPSPPKCRYNTTEDLARLLRLLA